MNISSTIRAYKTMIYSGTGKSQGVYELKYLRLRKNEKKLVTALAGRIATRVLFSRCRLEGDKRHLDKESRCDAIIITSIIKGSRSRQLDGYLPILKQIASGVDPWKETGACGHEIVRGLKRGIESGALR